MHLQGMIKILTYIHNYTEWLQILKWRVFVHFMNFQATKYVVTSWKNFSHKISFTKTGQINKKFCTHCCVFMHAVHQELTCKKELQITQSCSQKVFDSWILNPQQDTKTINGSKISRLGLFFVIHFCLQS